MTNKNYYEEWVNRALDYITQHLDSDLSLDKLAHVSHLSQAAKKNLSVVSTFSSASRLYW